MLTKNMMAKRATHFLAREDITEEEITERYRTQRGARDDEDDEVSVCIFAYIGRYVCMRERESECVCMCVKVCVFVYVYVCVHVRICIYIYIYIYICVSFRFFYAYVYIHFEVVFYFDVEPPIGQLGRTPRVEDLVM